ncbi:MAG: DUF58 domain-containing protein [Planctomycetes bacterium]|nr:DUF58 domain-containing protein [Planctomycetota bacterium]
MQEPQGSSDPRRYLDPKVLARLSRLDLKARLVVEGFISGLHQSPYHGLSIEFAEHREYVPGDDIRHIDWKVFGRSDRFYIKQYEEETNLKAFILLDASESMLYPEAPRSAGGTKPGANQAPKGQTADRRISKFEYATYIAASLSYLILRQQDAVGMAIFDSEVRSYLPPSSNPSYLQNLLAAIEKTELQEKTRVGNILHEFADRIQKKGLIIVISDLFDGVDQIKRGLKHLRYKGHEILVIHVLDREELTFPFQRMTLFEGLEGLEDLLADPRALRKGYVEEMNTYLEEVGRTCRDQRVDYVQLDTEEKLHVALSAYLAKRAGNQKV